MYNEEMKIMDRREMMKIKVMSLAEEARIIRRLENRAKKPKLITKHDQGQTPEHQEGLALEKIRLKALPNRWGQIQEELRQHRTQDLREAARNAHVAYGIICGRTIDQMEPTRKSEPNWTEVWRMVKKYGAKTLVIPLVEQKLAA